MREHLYRILQSSEYMERPGILYGRAMTVIIMLSLVPLMFKEEYPVLRAIEWACTVIFIVDYFARWATADIKLGRGKWSFLLYPFTPMAIIDLLTILPTFMVLNPAWRTLRALRLLRVLRVFKLIRYSKNVDLITRVFTKHRHSLLVVVALALGWVLVSALVIFSVEPDTFETFFDAIYWAVVSLTTVGYGDLYPVTTIGRTIAMLSSFVGIAVVALPAGIITAGLLEELQANERNDEGNAEGAGEGDGAGESETPAATGASESEGEGADKGSSPTG